MKAQVLIAPNTLELQELDILKPKKGQVLVKMAFSPINPSDLSFLTGNYGLKKEMPVVPGLEGSGIVIESGGGFLANRLLTKKVACAAPNWGNGTWAEYMVTDATKCVPLKENISLEQGSMLFVNPLTAIAFINKAKESKADLIIMNASGSALSAMVMNLAKEAGIAFVGVVRSVKTLTLVSEQFRQNGAIGLESSSENFYESLTDISNSYKKAIFFDAVGGGEIPFKILACLPPLSEMVIYGRLDLSDSILHTGIMIFKNYQITGFWLSKELSKKTFIRSFMDTQKVQKLLSNGYKTKIHKTVTIEDLQKAVMEYPLNMSAGKVLLRF